MIITITVPFPSSWGQGEDTHIYLLKNDEGAILIDAGLDCEDNRKFIKNRLKELEVRNLESILITHGHIDHFGLAGYLQEETGAEILVHELDGKFLKDYRNAMNWFDENYETLIEGGYHSEELKLMRDKMLIIIEMLKMPKYYRTFKNLNNFKVESLHLPGHTSGSVGYILGDVIFSGDVAIEGSTVVENLRMEINSIQKLKSFKYIFPAHRKTPLLKEDIENLEKHFINRLEDLLRILRNGMRLRDIIRNIYGEEGSFRDLLRVRNVISYLRFLEEEGHVMKRGQFWISIRNYFE